MIRSSPTIAIYPTHAHVAAHMAAAAQASDRGIALGRTAWTIHELEDAVLDSALPDVRRLDALEERLLVRRIALEESARGGPHAAITETPGFIDAFGATLGACRQAGIDAEALARAAGSAAARAERHGAPSGASSERIARCAALLEAFDARAADLGVVDRGRAVWLAAHALREGAALPPWMTGTARLVVRHVHELSPVRIALLDAIAARLGAPGELAIELAYRQGAEPYFRAVERLLGRLESSSSAQLTVLPVDPFARDGVGARLGALVASTGRGTKAAAATPADGEAIRLLDAHDPDHEHRAIARVVRAWIEEGIAPERIAIAPRALETHASGLTDALEAAGVPVHERRGTPARHAPPVRWVLDLLDAAENGWPRDVVARLVAASHAAPLLSEHGVTDAAAASRAILRVSVQAEAADSGARLRAALVRLAGDRSGRGTSARDAVAAFDALRSAVAGVVAARDVRLFASRLRDLVSAVRLSARDVWPSAEQARLGALVAHEDDAIAAAEARAVGRDEAALEAFDAATRELERAAATIGIGGPLSPAMLARLVGDALSFHTVGPGGVRGGAVRIVALRDVAGLGLFDAIVVPGLVEGELPAPVLEDPLLHVADRLATSRAFDVDEREDGGRVAFATRREEEPLLFVLAVGEAHERLALTRARSDPGGRTTVASPFVGDTLAALRAGGVTPCVESLPIEPSPPIGDAFGLETVRRSAMHATAAVAPGTGAVEAAQEAIGARAPPVLALESLLERAAVERRRLAAMLRAEVVALDRFSGRVRVDEPARARLAAIGRGDASHPWSATDLEEAASCAFKDFARRVLRVGRDDEADEDVDARRRGDLAHRCFEAAMRALVESGLVPYRASSADEAALIAEQAATETARAIARSMPLEPTLVALEARATVRRVVRLVRRMYEADDSFEPIAIERPFGGPRQRWPALEVPGAGEASAEAENVFLRGRADLVERRGEHLRVSDLKTGAREGLERNLSVDRMGVVSLQLPIYAAAARRIEAGPKSDLAHVDVRYLSLRDGEPTDTLRERMQRSRRWRDDPRSADSLLDVADALGAPTALARRIAEIAARMRAGEHPVAPFEDACRRCDYHPLCRIPAGAPTREEP